MMNSSGATSFLMPAASISRMCFTVMRLFCATISLPDLSLMSKRATSPRSRSGTTSNRTWFGSMLKLSNAKNSLRIRSGV